jgi:hypothetical protein
MEFTVKGTTVMIIDVAKETPDTWQILGSRIKLESPVELDPAHFVDEEGEPNSSGAELLTMCLVTGLAAHVHCCADKGTWDRAAHMRHIFENLENLFVAQGKMVDKKKL